MNFQECIEIGAGIVGEGDTLLCICCHTFHKVGGCLTPRNLCINILKESILSRAIERTQRSLLLEPYLGTVSALIH